MSLKARPPQGWVSRFGTGPSFFDGRSDARAIFAEKLRTDLPVRNGLRTLSGARLDCHCTPNQRRHVDEGIRECKSMYPGSPDRDNPGPEPPLAMVLDDVAKLREESYSDEGSSAHGRAPKRCGE